MEIRNEFQIAERDFAQSSVVLSDNRQRRHLQTGKEFMLPLSSNENELKYEIKERRVPALVAIGYEECSRWRWEPPERNRTTAPDVSVGTGVQTDRSWMERSKRLASTSTRQTAPSSTQQASLCR